jgi:hypothetical protein
MRNILFTLMVFGLVGCASVQEMNANISYLNGMKIDRAIKILGIGDPTSFLELENRRVYVWQSSGNMNMPMGGYNYGTDQYGNAVTTWDPNQSSSQIPLKCKITINTTKDYIITNSFVEGDSIQCNAYDENLKRATSFLQADEGTYTFPDGAKYVGEYQAGKRHGQGTYTFANGNKYIGEFKDGKKHGQGTYTFTDGNKYVGEYQDDKTNGQGTYTFANGNNYVGEFKDDKWHGQGTFTLANGVKYVGVYQAGKPVGQGTLISPGKGKYVGEFKDGMVHGKGTFTFANGDKYVGDYQYNKAHGKGTFTFADGKKYVGEYQDDKWHGQGTLTRNDGTELDGYFMNGEFVPSICEDMGLLQGTDAYEQCVNKLIDEAKS